jgi:hypothetical protein
MQPVSEWQSRYKQELSCWTLWLARFNFVLCAVVTWNLFDNRSFQHAKHYQTWVPTSLRCVICYERYNVTS